MKITDVEAIILRQPDLDDSKADGSQDALLIRIQTDEGITGVGEVDSLPPVIKAMVEAPTSHAVAGGLRQMLIGENPLEIDRLWEKMYRGTIYCGRRSTAIHAMSGVDIALWDIKGKALGLPVSQLLGGPHTKKIRAYASTLMPETPEECFKVVSENVERGFTAIKLGWGPWGRDADLDIVLAKAAREAAGDKVELMFDIGLGWPNADHAIKQVRRLEEYRPYWVEEPLWPDELDGYRKLADTVETRIAAGEQDSTRWGFEDLMERCRVDVVQPDVTRAGGISEVVKIGRQAELRGTMCVTHSWSTGIIKAASLHALAALPKSEWFEYCVQDTPLNKLLTDEQFPIDSDGMVEIPTKPGLGIEIDDEVVARFTVA